MSRKYFFSLVFLALLTISLLLIGKEVLAWYACKGNDLYDIRDVCYFGVCVVEAKFIRHCAFTSYSSWSYYCDGNNQCKKRTIYRGYCSGGSCRSYSSTQSSCTYCGSTSYSSWSNYCSGSNLYKKRTVYNRGCSGSSCYSSTSTQTSYVKNCGTGRWTSDYRCSGNWRQRRYVAEGCSNNKCYDTSQWRNDTNCGTGRWTNDYRCSGSWRQRRYVAEGCSNNKCYDTSQWRNDTNCGTGSWTNNYQCSGVWIQRQKHNKGCSGSACYDNYSWENDTNCGTSSWTNNYQCSGVWIQREKHKKGCSGSSCYDNYSWENDVDCSKECEGGTCTVGSVYCLCPSLPPYIKSLSLNGTEYCNTPEGIGRIGFKWIYKDANNDKQSHYHIHIATDSGFSNLVVDYVGAQSLSSGGTGTSAVKVKLSPTADTADLDIGFNDTYYWKMRVQAEGGDWSDWKNGGSFSTPKNPYPRPNFTWELKDHEEEMPMEKDVLFTNQTVSYALPNSYSWTFQDGNPPTSNEENPTVKFTLADPPEKEVTLSVVDSNGYFCPPSVKSVTVTEAELPLPEWKEIPPF